MKKIPTLFVREFDNHKPTTLNQVTVGCEWVLNGEGIATRKYDGTCVLIEDGKYFKRYDAKNGKPIPQDAILCQPEADAVTEHLPCWVPVKEDSPQDKWFVVTYQKALQEGVVFENGTYELVGPHFNANPDKFEEDTLVKHGRTILDVTRTYEGIKQYLTEHEIEGIVFHRGNGEMTKIKRSDFNLPWQAKGRK